MTSSFVGRVDVISLPTIVKNGGSLPTVRWDRVRPVRVVLPDDGPVRLVLEELVLEAGARGQIDGHVPERVAVGVSIRAEGDRAGRGPVAQLGDRAGQVDRLPVTGADDFVEGHSHRGRSGAWGATGGC